MDVFESPGSLSLRHNIKTKIEQSNFSIMATVKMTKISTVKSKAEARVTI